MPNFAITSFRNAMDNKVSKKLDVTWHGFCKRLTEHQVVNEKKLSEAFSPVSFAASLEGYTFEKFVEKIDKASGEVSNIGKLWMRGERRIRTDMDDTILRYDINVREIFMVVIDYDHVTLTPEELIKPFEEFNYAFYSTYSYDPPKNASYRLVLPLRDPLSPEQFRAVWPALVEMAPCKIDEKCDNLSRIWFMPTCPPGKNILKVSQSRTDGKWLHLTAKAVQKAVKQEKSKEASARTYKALGRVPLAERGDYRTLDAIQWFLAHGLFLGPGPRVDAHYVKCPWMHEHSPKADQSRDTVLYTDPGRWPTFNCSHSHCKGRDIVQVNELWGDIDKFCAEKFRVGKMEGIKEQIKTGTSIRCLGYEDAGNLKHYWYQCSENDSITRLKAGEHKKLGLLSITADVDYWYKNYGDKDGKIDWEAAALDLLNRGNKAGPIRPSASVRGLGPQEDAGRIVVHLGRDLLVDGKPTAITAIKSEFIYQRCFPEIKLPAPMPQATAARVAQFVDRFPIPKMSEKAMLAGHMVAGLLAGVLDYRPHLWLTGLPESGKSSVLKHFVSKLWTPIGGLLQDGKTTAAGIRQSLKNNIVPVAVDESEANGKDEITRVAGLLTLARSATSGSEGGIKQGSPLGDSLQYRVRSCFILCSISPALIRPEDKQRFSVINFKASPASLQAWPVLSSELKETLTKDFATAFYARALTLIKPIQDSIIVFRKTIMGKVPTASSRFCDQVGTLLACYYTYFSDEAITPEKAWTLYERLGDWEEYRADKFEDNSAYQVYSLLMTHQVIDGPKRWTVAEILEHAISLHPSAEESEKLLRRHGLRIDKQNKKLFISNNHHTLNEILTSKGVVNHNAVLREYPGAELAKTPQRLDASAATYRGIWIPMVIKMTGGSPPPSQPELAF